MSAERRKKARDLIKLALDERNESEKERVTAAFQACKLIDKYGLLDSPLDDMLDGNETARAVRTIKDTVTNPEIVDAVKTVASVFRRRRR